MNKIIVSITITELEAYSIRLNLMTKEQEKLLRSLDLSKCEIKVVLPPEAIERLQDGLAAEIVARMRGDSSETRR